MDEYYLMTPEGAWITPTTRELIRFIERLPASASEEIKGYFRNNGADYYETVYWRMLSSWIKSKRTICADCGAGERLQVHHLTYDHVGEEYLHLKDLIVLCEECHKERHGLSTESKGMTVYDFAKRETGRQDWRRLTVYDIDD